LTSLKKLATFKIMISDIEFINKLKSNDQSALGTLFTLYKDDLYKVLYHRVSDKSLLEDVIQQTFVKLWENRNKIQISSSLKSYIFRIAINIILDEKKHEDVKTKYKDRIIDLYEKNDHVAEEENEVIHSVHKIISELPKPIPLAFYLSRYGSMTYIEIADMLNLSVKTIESYISKVLKILREKIKKE
jgi:RNA polymerase sigma-70 factor, ECF subfamily